MVGDEVFGGVTLVSAESKVNRGKACGRGLFVVSVCLLYAVLFCSPVTVTLDGYSHLYHAHLLKGVVANDPVVLKYFSANSVLTPNWLCASVLALLSECLPVEWALKLFVALIAMLLYKSISFCVNAVKHDASCQDQIRLIILKFVINPYLIVLFGILLAGTAHKVTTLHRATDERKIITMGIIAWVTSFLYLAVPGAVGEGSMIEGRVLLYAAIAVLLSAMARVALRSRWLVIGAAMATMFLVGFAAEYWLVSSRLGQATHELESAMSQIPKKSRIVVMGYRMAPFCEGSPLLERSRPERHWALKGALKYELIVQNDYQPVASIFPIQLSLSGFGAIVNEVAADDGTAVGRWSEFVSRAHPAVDYIVSWGTPSGVKSCAGNLVNAPLEEMFKVRYERIVRTEVMSRVSMWRRRADIGAL